MATYNTAFGSLPGYNELLGTTNTTGGGQQQTYGGAQTTTTTAPRPAQTFSQMQQQGIARPPAPQAQPFQQYGGSQQGQQMRQRLQEQLATFGNQPSRYDTQAFQQIRGAQAANLQAEYQGQQKALNEDLARRGLLSSSIGAGRMGDLAGQQARALSSLDAQLLQSAAETQAQDRAQLLQSGQGLAELAGAQDLAQFEANRVGQATEFEQMLRAAQFGQGQYETEQGYGLRLGELTGELGGMQTLAGRQQAEQARQFDIEQGLRQVLGLGGLGIQQEQLGLERERLTQQKDDAAAERTLREKMQTAELTAQEAQQLRDIDARKALQTQQLTEQARQFGLSLDDQQAARIYQGGFTTEELALKRQQIDNDLKIQNRQLTETERNNLAINGLETDKLEADKDFRSQQLGLNKTELEQRASQIKEDQRLRGLEITNEKAYREAELELRTTQIVNENTRAGQQIDVEKARIQAQKDISTADNAAQLARLNAQIASQEKEGTAERMLRQMLGLTEATGQTYNIVNGQLVAGTDTLQSRLQQAGITGTFGGRLTQSALQDAYQRAAQLSQITGQQYTVDSATGAITAGAGDTLAARLQQAELTGTFGGNATLARLQQNLQQAQILSQITGRQYTVNSAGAIVEGSAQSEAARTANLEAELRRQLGLTEASGYVYDMVNGVPTRTTTQTTQGMIARNELMARLADILGSLSADRFGAIAQQTTNNPLDRPGTTVGQRVFYAGATYEWNGVSWTLVTPQSGAD